MQASPYLSSSSLCGQSPPLHSPPRRGGGGGGGLSLAPNMYGAEGAKRKISSGYNGVEVERLGLGPGAWSSPGGGGP